MRIEDWKKLLSAMSDDTRSLNRETISALTGQPAGVTSDKRGALSLVFERWWKELDGPELTTEYRFEPKRRWRADYRVNDAPVLIEIEGGIWAGGRHTRAKGFIEDTRKYNAAAALGFTVFRLPTGFRREDVAAIVDFALHHMTSTGE